MNAPLRPRLVDNLQNVSILTFHRKYENLFGRFCTVLHTESSEGVSLPVVHCSNSTKSARKSIPYFYGKLVLSVVLLTFVLIVVLLILILVVVLVLVLIVVLVVILIKVHFNTSL